jgi:hypothetical protein
MHEERRPVGKIAVHEFMPLDGVVEAPRWPMDYALDPKMGRGHRNHELK